MTNPSDDRVPPPAGSRLRRTLGKLAWVATGGMLATLILANPLHFPTGERQGGTSATPRPGIGKPLFYRNPMNPAVTSPVPMKDEMGMDYIPVYEGHAAAVSGAGASVTIDPSVVQNMNVQVQEVRRVDLKREIRTVGYLEYDQQKMVTVTTKYPGFIERVYVNYPGEPVRRGQALFEIYAPELVQTEQDLLSALEFAARLRDAPGEAPHRAQALVAAARARFAFWDIRASQIEELEETKKVFRTLRVSAPSSGVVMKRLDGLEGMAVKPGMELYHIADLSSLWLTVEVFEGQLGWLQIGSVADIALSYFPGETFTGRVRLVEPEVSEKTRTVPLRLEVPNRDGRLRAGMYATVRFQPVIARGAIVVPSDAVLRTGERNLVVLAEGEGHFAPREVTLGSEGEGSTEVLSGLQPGDKVVTSSQFLIDSESNLREAIQKMVAAVKAK